MKKDSPAPAEALASILNLLEAIERHLEAAQAAVTQLKKDLGK